MEKVLDFFRIKVLILSHHYIRRRQNVEVDEYDYWSIAEVITTDIMSRQRTITLLKFQESVYIYNSMNW